MNEAIGWADTHKCEFVIAGDSHMFSMGASQGYTGPASLCPIENLRDGYFLIESWGTGRSGSYWEALTKQVEGRAAVLVVMGNQHFSNFLLARMPLFDFVDPLYPNQTTIPGAVIVPQRMVKALPAFDNTWLRNIIGVLLAHKCRHVFVVGTPPVRADYADYMEHLRGNASWRHIAEGQGVDIETCDFTPAPIMKRLWGVLQDSLKSGARAAGARFLPIPAKAFDSDGFLSQEYRGPLADFTHPNRAYGLLMLDEIARSVANVTSGYEPIDNDIAIPPQTKLSVEANDGASI